MKILVAWDWGSDGIWLLPSRVAEPDISLSPRAPDLDLEDRDQLVRWSDVLSENLLRLLKSWNDEGGELFGSTSERTKGTGDDDALFWRSARDLAVRVHSELGPDSIVWYQGEEGICHLVSTGTLET